jgi:hypothetical protein
MQMIDIGGGVEIKSRLATLLKSLFLDLAFTY